MMEVAGSFEPSARFCQVTMRNVSGYGDRCRPFLLSSWIAYVGKKLSERLCTREKRNLLVQQKTLSYWMVRESWRQYNIK